MSADPVTVPPPKGFIDPIAFLTRGGGDSSLVDPGDYYFLRVCGDSLAEPNSIFDGDLLLVRRSRSGRALPGEMVLAAVGDQARVVRYESDEWRAMVEYRDLHDLLGDQVDEIQVQGVVCGIVRRF